MTAIAPNADIIMRVILLIVFGLLTVSCIQENTWSSFERYPESGEISSFEFENRMAFQRTYFLDKDYPYSGVMDHYESIIHKPWIACKPWNKNWEDYLDASGNEPMYVHRMTRHWANKETNRLLMLLIQYRSKSNIAIKVPNNNTQTIILVEYIESDLQGALDRLKLNCSGISE